jgi:O-antigen ligase
MTSITEKSKTDKLVSLIDLGLISSLFFLHLFTVLRNDDNYIEYDYHYFIIIMCVFVVFKCIWYIVRPHRLTLNLPQIASALLLLLVYVAISSIIKNTYNNKILGCLCLLMFLFFQWIKIIKTPNLIIPVSLLFLVGTLACQFFLLCKAGLFTGQMLNQTLGSGSTACYLAAIFPFTISLIFTPRKNRDLGVLVFWLAIFSSCLTTYIFFSSTSRTAWIACALGASLVLINKWSLVCTMATFFRNNWVKLILFVVAFSTCLITFYFLYNYRPGSVDGRLLIYEVGGSMVANNPIFGSGLGSFEYLYNLAQADYLSNGKVPYAKQLLADNTFFAFNEYLRVAIEFGIVGVILLLLVAIAIYRQSKKIISQKNLIADNNIVLGAIGSLLSITICSLSSYPFHILSVSVLIVFYLAIIARDTKSYVISVPFSFILALLLVIVMSFSMFNEYRRMISLKNWKTAAGFALNDNFSKARPIYEKVYPILHTNGRFLFNYGAELFIDGNKKKSIKILEKSKETFSHSDLYLYLGRNYDELGMFEKSENNYKTASAITPSRFIPKELLFDLYTKYKKIALAKSQADLIVKYPVKIPSDTVTKIKLRARRFLTQN